MSLKTKGFTWKCSCQERIALCIKNARMMPYFPDLKHAAQVAKRVSDLPLAWPPDYGNYESFHQAGQLLWHTPIDLPVKTLSF